jgi:hypothetical protein
MTMIDDKTQAVLAEILGQTRPYAEDGMLPATAQAPGFDALTRLATVLADEAEEDALHRCLAANPEVLLGYAPPSAGIQLAFLSKPRVGTLYRADFAILAVGQGGGRTMLFEIERSTHDLFTRTDVTESLALRHAIGQVRDWHSWIEANKPTFTRDLLLQAEEAPLYPQRTATGSFRLLDSDKMNELWGSERGYGSFDEPGANFTIVIGRWSQLEKRARQRLVQFNAQSLLGQCTTVVTYDQLARAAYHRPHRMPQADAYFGQGGRHASPEDESL